MFMNNHMSRSKYQARRRTTKSDSVHNQNASHTAGCEPIRSQIHPCNQRLPEYTAGYRKRLLVQIKNLCSTKAAEQLPPAQSGRIPRGSGVLELNVPEITPAIDVLFATVREASTHRRGHQHLPDNSGIYTTSKSSGTCRSCSVTQ